MGKCININLQEFKDLVEQTQQDPIRLAANISKWQDTNNTDDFPTLEEIQSWNNVLITDKPKTVKFPTTSGTVSSFARLNNLNKRFKDTENGGYKVYEDTYEFVYDQVDKMGVVINPEFHNPVGNEVSPAESLTSPTTIAFYSKESNSITLTERFNDIPIMDQAKILVHEGVHGIVTKRVSELNEDELRKFEDKINSFIIEVRKNSELQQSSAVQKALQAIQTHGYQELITYAFTNSEFAAALNSVMIDEKDGSYFKRTFWEKLKELILSVISDGYSMMDELVDILDAHLEINSKQNPGIYNLNFSKEVEDVDSHFIRNDYASKLAELDKDEAETLHQKLTEADGEGKLRRTNKLLNDVESKLKGFLNSVGVSYESVQKIYDSEGNEINAVAKADIFNKIVQVIEGKRDYSTLPEETAHVFTFLIRGTPLYDSMMEKITRFKIYKETKDQYEEQYGFDENKIKEEAIAKLISIQILNQETAETDLNKDLAAKWWVRLWNFIKSKLGGLKSSEMSPFIESAKQILSGQVDNLIDLDTALRMTDSDVKGLIFYEMSEEDINNRDALIKELTNLQLNPVLTYDHNTETYKDANGRTVKYRVSDYITRYWASMGITFEASETTKLKAAKGTYIHKMNQLLMKELIDGKKISNTEDFREAISSKAGTELLNTSKEIREIYNKAGVGLGFFNITKEQFGQLVDGINEIYNQIQENSKRIKKYTQGATGDAKIFTELSLYLEKEDLAGTIDVAVVYPNGAVAIYDYKSTSFYNNQELGVTKGFSEAKIGSFDVQIGQYKRMFAEQYKVTAFAESRIVPINVQLYSETVSKKGGKNPAIGFYWLEMGNKKEKEYLQQVPVSNELITEDKDLSNSLQSMLDYREKIRKEKQLRPENQNLQLQYERIDKAVREIQLHRDINYIAREIFGMLRHITKLESDPVKSPNYNLRDFNNYITFAEIFENFSTDVLSKGTILTKENHDILKGITLAAQSIKSKALNKIIESIDRTQDATIITPLVATGDIGGIFKNLQEYDGEIYKRLANLVELSLDNTRREFNAVHELMQDKHKALEKWAKKNNMSVYEAFKKIYNQDKRGLVSKFKKEFYESFLKARKDKDVAWMQQNTEVTEENKLRFEEKKKEVFAQLEKEFPGEEDANGVLTQDGVAQVKERERQMKLWLSKYDVWSPETKQSALVYKKNYYLTLKDLPENHSEEWKYLAKPENKPLMDYYNTYIDLNNKFNAMVERPIKRGFVAEIRQETVDKFRQTGLKAAGNIFHTLKHSLEAREFDISERQRDPSTGKILPSIPLLYMDPIRDGITTKELANLKKEVEADGLTPGHPAYETELEKRVKKLEYQKGAQFKSFDLTTSMLLFAETVYTNKHFTETADEVNALQNIMRSNKISTQKTNIFGEPLKVNGQPDLTRGAPISDIGLFDKFVNTYWYGLELETNDWAIRGNKVFDENGNLISEGKIYSGIKFYNLISKWTTLKSLPFNLPAAIGNAIGLYSNFHTIAAEGILFNEKQATKAETLFFSNNKLAHKLIDYFEPSTRDLAREKALNLSGSKLKKWTTMDKLMFIWKNPDDAADGIILLSSLQNYGIDKDGKIKILSKLPVENQKSLLDLAKIEKNKIVLPGITDNQTNFLKFKRIVARGSESIKGMTSENNKNQVNKMLLTKIIMKFRNWIPGLAKARFGKVKYDDVIEQFNGGRYNFFLGEMLKWGGLGQLMLNFSNLASQVMLSTPIVNRLKGDYNVYNKNLNTKATEYYYKEFIKNYPKYEGKISLEEYKKLRIQKLAGLAKEINYMILMYLAMLGMGAAIPDDKKEKFKKAVTKLLYNSSRRGLLELSFWSNPASVDQLMANPVADWGTIKALGQWVTNTFDVASDTIAELLDIGDPEYHAPAFSFKKASKDKTPFMYRTWGLVPLGGNIVDVLDIYDENVIK